MTHVVHWSGSDVALGRLLGVTFCTLIGAACGGWIGGVIGFFVGCWFSGW